MVKTRTRTLRRQAERSGACPVCNAGAETVETAAGTAVAFSHDRDCPVAWSDAEFAAMPSTAEWTRDGRVRLARRVLHAKKPDE